MALLRVSIAQAQTPNFERELKRVMEDRVKRAILVFFLMFGVVAVAQVPTSMDIGSRTAYQKAVEEVYWQHRVWPEQNSGTKPSLDSLISSSELQDKAENGLRLSNALETLWHQPISGSQLQAEIVRITRDTKQPEL